ncbi:MAG: chromosome segregation protein SMC [Porticoccaceae bacterium]
MRLKTIKLAGFKSFVDPTSVHFPSNLSAVVGPNGCGKSNIIDAVRWVMGESSAKNLRGESMTDVIFNGSGGRKPVGQASIELVFDNSSGTLGGEYGAYNEIAIRRKVTRDGQSSYYLNGNKCRRRDITDIFLGTGLGPRSYAIIEQGMISRLIESKPDELRVYIEEAAGISKYKERRKDTESRIRRTMENLERLTDIRDELGRQLARLERQAKAAEKYAEYKQEQRQVSAELLALKWRQHEQSASQQRQVIGQLEVEQERIVTERAACDTHIEKGRDEYTQASDRFNEVQARFYKVGADVARIEQAIEHAQQRASELQQDLAQTESSFAESDQHLHADRARAAGWQAELDQLLPDLELATAAHTDSAQALEEAEQQMSNWQSRWDEFNQSSASPRQQAEVQQSRIQHLEQMLRRLSERQANLSSEAEEFQASPAEDEIALLQESLAEAQMRREQLSTRQSDLQEEVEQCRRDDRELAAELDQMRSEQRQLQGRQSSLEALQQAAMGDDSERQWLEQSGLSEQPRLAALVEPQAEWTVAVETVLGSYLQAVAVDSIADQIDKLSSFAKGEILLVSSPTSGQTSKLNGVRLSSLVRGEHANSLLDSVYAVDDLVAALALQPELAAGESVVTKDGVWLGANWLRVARDKDASAGLLQRKQELEKIEQQLEKQSEKIERAAAARTQLEEKIASLEEQRRDAATLHAEQQSQYTELRSKLSGFEVQIEQYKARKQRAEGELAEVRDQYGQEQESLAEARALLQESLDLMERDSALREELMAERDTVRQALDEIRQRARQDRDQQQELAMRERSLTTQLSSVKESISRLEVQVERLAERREQLRAAFEIKEDPSDNHRAELEEQLELRIAVETELAEARAINEELEQQMRGYEQRRAELERELFDLRGKLEQQRIAAQEITTLSQTIAQQIEEKDHSLEALLEALPESADMREWQQSIEQIEARIQRLGPINLAAIDEYKIESERKDYLDQQNGELEEALRTLEGAIQKIDKETRTRFKETFDEVNKHIQALFPKLFGGGHAYLEMTGEDLLDTGVSLMARPPGKKNASIHLLSGGEKALTAIAMVFAIFQLNPAPFCMLDEVDAPLDDANVGRYAKMVEEMSEKVQFIFITHNKIPMEVANQLIGVTMHEAGVSRLVTVDVNQAAALAEA